MKRLLLLFIPLVFFFGCDPNDESENTSYNCVNDECFSANEGSGQYNTLADCLIVCGNENISYNCIDNECFSADEGSGQYATLDDCLSVCGNINYNCSTEGCVESEDGQYATIQECENICNCNCGIVTEVEIVPAFEGVLIPDPVNPEEFILEGEYPSYGFVYVDMNCNNSNGAGQFCCSPENCNIGETFCGTDFDEEGYYSAYCTYVADLPCFDVATNQWGIISWAGLQREWNSSNGSNGGWGGWVERIIPVGGTMSYFTLSAEAPIGEIDTLYCP